MAIFKSLQNIGKMDSDLEVAQYLRDGLILDKMLLVLGHDLKHIVAPSYNQITKARKEKQTQQMLLSASEKINRTSLLSLIT